MLITDIDTKMDLYTTIIKAVCARDGQLKYFAGPHVPGISFADAQNYCFTHGLGYCTVDGLLIAEIPCKEGSLEPDWDNMTDYENQRLN